MSINEIKPGAGKWTAHIGGMFEGDEDSQLLPITDVVVYRDGPWCSFTCQGRSYLTNRPVILSSEKK